ncbi:MAG: FtsQ-type POTRA domain-containing protein [Ruthenibacterium sp.]
MAKQTPKRSQFPTEAPSAKKTPQRPVYDFQTSGAQTGRAKQTNRLVYDYKKETEKRVPMQRMPETPIETRVQQTAPPQPAPEKAHALFDQKQALPPTRKARQGGMQQMVLPLGTVHTQQQPPPRQTPPRQTQKEPQQSNAQTNAAPKKGATQQQSAPPKKSPKKPLTYGEARRRRRNRNLLAVFAVVLVLAVGVVLSFTVLFKIKTITITGDVPYTQEEIRAKFERQPGDNLFSFKTQTAQNALTTALPYLEKVTIKRRLPDRVEIDVTAATETYKLNSAAGWLVLSGSFKVLRVEAQPPTELVLLMGADVENPVPGMPLTLKDAAKMDILRTLSRVLGGQAFAPIYEIDVTNPLELSFLYDNRIRVLLGTTNELEAKIEWAKYLCVPGTSDESRAATDRGTLDVSSRNAEGRLKAGWIAGAL